MAVFPEPEVLLDQEGDPVALDLHPPSDWGLSFEEPATPGSPQISASAEQPSSVTLEQVLGFVRSAAPDQRRRVQDELRNLTPTRNRRVQWDPRPLVRDAAIQVDQAYRVTRLARGGLQVESGDVLFRVEGQVEEAPLHFAD